MSDSRFEIKQNGVTKGTGKYPESFYNEKTIKSMKSAGCKILVDGKPYKEGTPCGK